jgi:hypothetical protein
MFARNRGRWIDNLYEAQKPTQDADDCGLGRWCAANPRDSFEHVIDIYRFARMLVDKVLNEACEDSTMGLPVTEQLPVFDERLSSS